MAKVFDRVKMTTATTGTGNITLGSAVGGFQTFADGGAVDADSVYYVIEDSVNWEIGIGTYTASGTILARTTVLDSSNAGSAINLSGNAYVMSALSKSLIDNKVNVDGDTLTGLLTLAANEGVVVPDGVPSSPVDGQIYRSGSSLRMWYTSTRQIIFDNLGQTLYNKTIQRPTITGYKETAVDPAAGTSFSPDLTTGTLFNYDTSGNTTITLPTAAAGESFSIRITYGGVHTITWAGETVEWAGGAAPDATSTSTSVDIYSFVCYEAGIWTGFDGGRDFS